MIISLKKKRFYRNIKNFPKKFEEISSKENWNEIIAETLHLIDEFNESCCCNKKIEEDNSRYYKMSNSNKVKNSGVLLKRIQLESLNLKRVAQENTITAETPSRIIEKRCKNIMNALKVWSDTLDIGPKKYTLSPLAVLHSKEIQNVFLEIKEIFSGNNSKLKLCLKSLAHEAKTQKEFLEKLIKTNQGISRSIGNKNHKIKEQFEKAKKIFIEFDEEESLKSMELRKLSNDINSFIETLNDLLGLYPDDFSNHGLDNLLLRRKHIFNAIEKSPKIIFKKEITDEISNTINFAQSFEYEPKIKHTRREPLKELTSTKERTRKCRVVRIF